jgi:hypothetical protein
VNKIRGVNKKTNTITSVLTHKELPVKNIQVSADNICPRNNLAEGLNFAHWRTSSVEKSPT